MKNYKSTKARTTNKKPTYIKPAQKQKADKEYFMTVTIKNHHDKKEEYPHFRYYMKSKHPALIVEEHSADEYKYRKVMHGDKDGDRANEKVFPNPNPLDKNPMYIGKRKRHDKKLYFGKRYPWKYPKK